MLTLLRKLRRSLVEKGNVKRYLLYAIGEITLVVIGILIALQVNTWNEHRLEKKIQHRSLNQLLEELRYDVRRLNHLDTTYVNLIGKSVKSIDLFSTAKNMSDIKEMLPLMDWIGMNLALQTSTYEEMINSGTMYTIQDQDLLKAISTHYKTVEKYEQYTRDHDQSVLQKWDQPAFAPFGYLILNHQNDTGTQHADVSWIDDNTHPTFQAAMFAMEYNLSVLRLKKMIVVTVMNSTEALISRIEESLE